MAPRCWWVSSASQPPTHDVNPRPSRAPIRPPKVSKKTKDYSLYSDDLSQSYTPSAEAGASAVAASPYASPSYAQPPAPAPSGPMGAIMQPRKVPVPGIGSFETSVFNLAAVFGVFG